MHGSRPGKAPLDKLAAGLANWCYHHEDSRNQVVPVVIGVWMESKPELRARVEQSLRLRDLAVNLVTSSNSGFRRDWPPESYHEVTTEIRAQNPSDPSDVVDLMIACLTGRAPVASEDSPDEVEPLPIDIDFDEWLSALRAVPETSKLWSECTRFLVTAGDISAHKRRLAVVGPALSEFRANAGAMQEMFGFTDCELWEASDFSSLVLGQVADELKALNAQLELFHRPLPASYKEQITQFEERKTAGQIVTDIYTRLAGLRNKNVEIPPETEVFERTNGPAPRVPAVVEEIATVPRSPGPERLATVGSLYAHTTPAEQELSYGDTGETTGPIRAIGDGSEPASGGTTMQSYIWRLVSEGRTETAAMAPEATLPDDRQLPGKTGPDVLWRHAPLKQGVSLEARTETKTRGDKHVAQWQSWEKTALDRKFRIIIRILGIIALGTITAIIGVTRKVLTEHQNPTETRPAAAERDTRPFATVTLKRDGSHFSGRVVRRGSDSITMSGTSNDTRTFLFSELSNIKEGDPDDPADSSKSAKAGTASAPSVVIPAGGLILPAGTEFPVRSTGFLDSCCVLSSAIYLGLTDADVKNQAGEVVVPEHSNVTIGLVENKTVDGRISLRFGLGAVDFDGRHYVVSPAKGGSEPGVTVAFTGAKEGSPEAKAHGLNVHLDNQAYMGFKAATPVVLKLSH